MTRLPWALLGIAPLGLTLACGSGEDRPKGGSGGTPADSGAGGSESGGTSGTGGTGNSTGKGGSTEVVDTKPPTFDGASGVDVTVAEDRVRVTWSPAEDDISPEKRIAYRVYRAAEDGAQDFTGARRCAQAEASLAPLEAARLPCFVTSGAGATSALVRDIVPAHPYFFVVRAVDEAGNEDTNTSQVSAQTDDATGPEFGGVRSVAVTSATSLRVTWGPGYDLASSDAELTFKVYAAEGKNPDPAEDEPVHESGPGEHEAVISALKPLTAYRILVRAVDPTGNQDGNERILGATTPEGLPPTFDGVSHALEEGLDGGKGRVRVFWAPATDNVTDTANIVYDIYYATQSRRQRYDRAPQYSSAPGAASALITGLEPGTRYFFVVRARDVGGNQDPNIREVPAITRPLDRTPPTFNGITAATSATPTSMGLTWSQATDAVTTVPANLTYLVYMSEATPVSTTGTPHLVVKGATSATIGGLAPGKTYHFAARARDLAGNLSEGGSERSASTRAADPSDTTAPDFSAGALDVKAAGATSVGVVLTWAAAADAAGAAGVRYQVCASMIQTDCEGADFFRHVVVTTPFNTLTATLASLPTRTDFYFYVRAEDLAGNVSAPAPFVRKATPTSFNLDVLPILSSRCGACHNFNSPGAIVGIKSQQVWSCPADPVDGCTLLFVQAGAPEFSAIYRKINPPDLRTSPFSATVPNEYGGLQEPRDTTDKLSGTEDDTIRTWIEQGALSN